MDIESSQIPAYQQSRNLKLQVSRSRNSMEEEDCDQLYGGCSDNSIEFTILEYQQSYMGNNNFNIERRIIEYLKSLGLKMKTDPSAKQDRYEKFQKKRSLRRAFTSMEEEAQPQTTLTPPTGKKEWVSMNMNTIISRRTPSSASGSSPLILMKEIESKKSKFCITKKTHFKMDESFSEEEEQIN